MQRALVILTILSLSLLTGACNTVIKKRWQNFNAYYNTYYNAEQFFSKGETQVKNSAETINPERPIRIHPTPANTGQADFENAITKAADVLREYPESKWVDDALLLIGKSYFYLRNYFSADQKFQELIAATNSSELLQEGIAWRGRFFLETQLYQNGIDYLEAQLEDEQIRWEKSKKAEVQLILAELYVNLEDWTSAEEHLVLGLKEASGAQKLAKAWFLLGQVRELLNEPEQAYNAYIRVARYNPDYTMVYQAKRKQADISRETGNLDQALRLFSEMSRDDKNFDLISDLRYEMARTYQLMEDYERAEQMFVDVLRYSLKAPTEETKAKSYFGIAEIAKTYYQDYLLAAAYYDSAALAGRDLTKFPKWFDAPLKATAFNSYKTLRTEAYEADSLLWLSGLTEQAFDSVVAVVKKRKFEEYKEAQRQQQKAASSFANPTAVSPTASTVNSGFLFHKNQSQVIQFKQAFKAIWGDRPLVDNWRRLDAVRLARQELAAADTSGKQGLGAAADSLAKKGAVKSGELTEADMEVDISKVPFKPEEKEATKTLIANRIFEIGNVFFLQLNQPDSAEYNYLKVIERFPETPVAAQAKYSLSELYFVDGDSVRAIEWAERTATEHPESVFRNRLAERYPDRITKFDVGMSRTDSLDLAFMLSIQQLRDEPTVKNIESLRALSAKAFDQKPAPDAMLFAANSYIELAKETRTYKERYPRFTQLTAEWDHREKTFTALQDSAKKILADTLSTKADSLQWKPIADSTFKRKYFPEWYPYTGALWDSSRAVLNQWNTQFPTHPNKDRVSRLLSALELPPYVKTYQDSLNKALNPPAPPPAAPTTPPDSTLDSSVKTNPPTPVPADSLGKLTPSLPDSLAAKQTPRQDTLPVSLPAVPDTTQQNSASTPNPQFLPDGRRIYTCQELQTNMQCLQSVPAFVRNQQLDKVFPNLPLPASQSFRIRVDEVGNTIGVESVDTGGFKALADFMVKAITEQLSFTQGIGPDGKPVVLECLFVINYGE